MAEIKAIETYYNGYRFRSRLEARWAVFFDTLGIEYQYEPEGFQGNGYAYLPDFYLHQDRMYVEVKPLKEGADESIEKATKFLGKEIETLLLLPNIPYDKKDGMWFFPVLYRHPVTRCVDYKFITFAYDIEKSIYCLDTECFDTVPEDPYEHRNMWAFDKDSTRRKALTEYLLKPRYISHDDAVCMYGDETMDATIMSAFKKARSARFEHGEKG